MTAEQREEMTAERAGGERGIGRRVERWLDSDLVGIPATLYTFLVLAVSLAVFRYGGPIAGIVVAIALWIPMVVFAIRGLGQPPAPLGLPVATDGPLHRVLVVANEGLEDPVLCDEVCRRHDRATTEAMIVAPVVAPSRLRGVSDDVDRELELAHGRVESAIGRLREAGVRASGHADIADPMESLLDGMREFPPNEVLLMPGRERRWEQAEALAERVRAEAGLPVTEVGAGTRA